MTRANGPPTCEHMQIVTGIACGQPAAWELHAPPRPSDEFRFACTDHVGELLEPDFCNHVRAIHGAGGEQQPRARDPRRRRRAVSALEAAMRDLRGAHATGRVLVSQTYAGGGEAAAHAQIDQGMARIRDELEAYGIDLGDAAQRAPIVAALHLVLRVGQGNPGAILIGLGTLIGVVVNACDAAEGRLR